MDPLGLGARIRELRRKRRITQQEFGKILHVSKSLVSDMENGRRRIHAELLCDIADVLGVSTDYLLGRTKADESAERELGAEPYYPERDYGARPDKDGHQNIENQQETELGTYGKKK